MKGWKFEPVRWMTAILSVLVAAEGVQEFVDLIPSKANGYVLIAIAVLAAVLGKTVRAKVTALAAPRDNDGNRLVPQSFEVRR
jgi:hypothetical protein